MNKKEAIAAIAVVIALIFAFTGLTPEGRKQWNNWVYRLQKADDVSSYSSRKEVEDTCRAMQASYQADRLAYEQYQDQGQEDWAQQAKMRANKTAAVYNEYVLKNSFVWEDNVPKDIRKTLDYIEEVSP